MDAYTRSKERERAALIRAHEEQAKLRPDKRERLPQPLSNATINRTIKLLSRVLEQALEYGHIDRSRPLTLAGLRISEALDCAGGT